MSDNNLINTDTNTNKYSGYSDSKGTGVLSTLIFAVLVVAIMVIIAYFKG